MHINVDTSRKIPVSWACAVEYIVWEHWADLASVCSTLTVVQAAWIIWLHNFGNTYLNYLDVL